MEELICFKEDPSDPTEDLRDDRDVSAWRRDERWERRSEWRESTSERRWRSRVWIASWSVSARDAAELEVKAAEEKREDEKDGERKAENIGSDANASSGEEDEEDEEVGAVVDDFVAVVLAVDFDVKEDRRWRGDDGGTTPGDAMDRNGVEVEIYQTWSGGHQNVKINEWSDL